MKKKLILLFIVGILISSLFYSCGIYSSNIPAIPYPGNLATLPPPASLPTPSPTQTDSPHPAVSANAGPTESPVFEPIKFTILATGDVMAHSDNLKSAYNSSSGEYSFNENYLYVKKFIDKADLSICNLETVTAGNEAGYTSFPLFNTPAAILDGLSYAGFDVLVTANNHSLDRGEQGILKTLDEINARGMLSSGTYAVKGNNYLTVEIKGVSVSILAYAQHLNGNLPLLPDEKHFMVNQMEKETITENINRAAVNSDLIIVYLHWGSEYTRETEDWQSSYAYDLINAGADIILGTHPHVIRPDEIVLHNGEAKYIIYSMGNFISNFIRDDNRKNALYTEDGVMINLNFTINASGEVELESVDPIPTWPYKYTDETGIHYEIIPVENALTAVHGVPYAAKEAIDSYNRTMESLLGFNNLD